MAFDITSYVLGKKSGGGGGGSSDFTTASVNIIGGEGQSFGIPYIYEYGGYCEASPIFDAITDNETVTAILYKCHCYTYLGESQGTISVTGEIEDLGNNEYNITGDCTITIS